MYKFKSYGVVWTLLFNYQPPHFMRGYLRFNPYGVINYDNTLLFPIYSFLIPPSSLILSPSSLCTFAALASTLSPLIFSLSSHSSFPIPPSSLILSPSSLCTFAALSEPLSPLTFFLSPHSSFILSLYPFNSSKTASSILCSRFWVFALMNFSPVIFS